MFFHERPFNARATAKWEKVRRRGLQRFIRVNGMLLFGGCTALAYSCGLPLLFGRPIDWRMVAASFVLFPIGGIWWAKRVWERKESRYRLSRRADAEKPSRMADQNG